MGIHGRVNEKECSRLILIEVYLHLYKKCTQVL